MSSTLASIHDQTSPNPILLDMVTSVEQQVSVPTHATLDMQSVSHVTSVQLGLVGCYRLHDPEQIAFALPV